MDTFWLEDVTTEHLLFLSSISHIIRHSDAATASNDAATKDIHEELAERGKIGHYDKDDKNAAVKTWLKSKKREYRDKEEGHTNGYGVV